MCLLPVSSNPGSLEAAIIPAVFVIAFHMKLGIVYHQLIFLSRGEGKNTANVQNISFNLFYLLKNAPGYDIL